MSPAIILLFGLVLNVIISYPNLVLEPDFFLSQPLNMRNYKNAKRGKYIFIGTID